MVTDLTAICVCSGNKELDISRAKVGLDFRESLKSKVPIRILGAGPDLYIALKNYDLFKNKKIGENEYSERLKKLDHHIELYNYILEKTGEIPEVVHKTKTLVQNVLYGFPDYGRGKFAIVTEPWHYKKFEIIQKTLKRKGEISDKLEFFNVPSPDTNYYNLVEKFLSNVKSRVELMRI